MLISKDINFEHLKVQKMAKRQQTDVKPIKFLIEY